MGSAASTQGNEDTFNSILSPGEPANPSRICVPVIKGNPVSKSAYEVGYKVGE